MLIIETSSYLFVTVLVLYFNDYDIHVNTLFKAVKNGFTVKVKNFYIQVQNAVYVKRIVTRLALFQFSEGQSRSSNRSHKAINYSGTPLPPFSLIRDFRKENTRGNVSKISVNHACYRQIGSKSTNHSH